jgi:hypothetical protein
MKTLKQILNNLFKSTEVRYNQLIYSEEYISSIWRIRYVEKGLLKGYVLYNKSTDRYLDIKSKEYFNWSYNNYYFKDCVTKSKKLIITKFHMIKHKNKNIKFSDEQILNEIDIKVIEKYLRNKKLNKIS